MGGYFEDHPNGFRPLRIQNGFAVGLNRAGVVFDGMGLIKQGEHVFKHAATRFFERYLSVDIVFFAHQRLEVVLAGFGVRARFSEFFPFFV